MGPTQRPHTRSEDACGLRSRRRPAGASRAKDRSPPNSGGSETASKVSRRTHKNRRRMIADRVAAVGFRKTARPRSTKFGLLQDADRIVDLDTEISDDAFQLRMTGPQVAGLPL